MTLLRDDARTARKPHRCDDCLRTISPGEQYRSAAGVSPDGLWTSKTCTHCDHLRISIWHVDPHAYDPDYGLDLAEYLRDADPALYEQMRHHWRTQGVVSMLLPLPELTP